MPLFVTTKDAAANHDYIQLFGEGPSQTLLITNADVVYKLKHGTDEIMSPFALKKNYLAKREECDELLERNQDNSRPLRLQCLVGRRIHESSIGLAKAMLYCGDSDTIHSSKTNQGASKSDAIR